MSPNLEVCYVKVMTMCEYVSRYSISKSKVKLGLTAKLIFYGLFFLCVCVFCWFL